jgi:thiol:disulfide interchange protein
MNKFIHSVYGILLIIPALVCGTPAVAADFQGRNVAISVALEAPIKADSTVWVLVHQEIRPGWHTYWQNPGMAGLPLTVDWKLPAGVTAGLIEWPVPERFEAGGVVGYGYHGEANFLVPLKASAILLNAPVRAKMKLSWLVCAAMCIPEETQLQLELTHANGNARLFARTRAALPREFTGPAGATYDARTLKLSVRDPAITRAPVAAVQFFPVTPGVIDDSVKPEIRIAGDELVVTAIRAVHASPATRIAGVITLTAGQAFAVSSDLKPAFQTVAVNGAETGGIGVVAAALLALVGGLVLNFMPCVLPVLSMKALALAQTGGNASELRREGLCYFGGVFAAFGVLAGVILAIKAGDAAVGWGFQLQSPIVVFWLALLMMAIGGNLLGLFELPVTIGRIGPGRVTRGVSGSFWTGALATLVATPCTAPFMGTAVAYSLLQPGLVTVTVLLALATGFALPVLALGIVPGFASLIPRPGPWTQRLREFLAFPMLGSGVWLLWVLDRQTGPSGLAIALSIAIGVLFVAWVMRLLARTRRLVVSIGGSAMLLAASAQLGPMPSNSDGTWAKWSPEAVAAARASGHPVLADFTAAWCVTCLVNERLALEDSAVAARLANDRVALLKADWTTQDSTITAELTRNRHSGVPLYLLYPPAGDTITLPQLLTPATVIEALAKVEGSVKR